MPCGFVAPADGIYPVVMFPRDLTTTGQVGTVDSPEVGVNQNRAISIFDVTVSSAGVAQPGRVYANYLSLRSLFDTTVSTWQSHTLTRTGYEYLVTLESPAGLNWALTSDDRGNVERATGLPIYASYSQGDPDFVTPSQNRHPDRADDDRHPTFFNTPDPLVVTGAGGLGEVSGFSPTPISPASQPIAGLAFTGADGTVGATNRGTGGTIAFSTPPAMDDLRYRMAIDLNRDGTFGNAADVVNSSGVLSSAGNSVAWNGRDAAGDVPGCGDYPYRVTTSLSEIHFVLNDMEDFGGMELQRLSLPTDPALGDPLRAAYNDVNPATGAPVTNTSPPAVEGLSGPAFHTWSANSGNGDWVDTWTRLPDIVASGTLRLLCSDPEVVKTAEPSPLVPGRDVTFRLTVKNNGPDTATNVSVRDVLPTEGATFKSASAGCSRAAGIVTCNLASLAPGATHTFEIVMSTDSSLSKCLENSVTVTNDTFDTNLANNESTICTPIRGESDLEIAKTASHTEVAAGGQVMFTLVVKNNGRSDDPGVEVSDPLVPGLTLVAADPSQGKCSTANNTLDCDIGLVRAGGSIQILVTAQVTGTECPVNTARVRGANEDPDLSNNEDEARVCPTPPPPRRFDLVVTKTSDVKRPYLGQTVTYRIVVRNNGPDAAPDAKLTDTLNRPVTVVSVRASQGSCVKRIPMRCELGTIQAGERVTITVRVKHRETGCNQRNAASATGAGTDTNPANNMDVVKVCVRKVPLRLSKVASRSVVQAGGVLSYRIRVSNPSKGEARNVRVCDRLPSGLSYVSSKPRAKRSGARVHCWTIKRLGAKQSRTFRVTVRAARGAIGRKVNTATASSPDVRGRTLRARDRVRVLGQATPVTG